MDVLNRIDDQIIAALKAGLGSAFRVEQYADHLETEDAIRNLASRVGIEPYILVNSAPVEAQDGTFASTGDDPEDAYVIEIIVAHGDLKDRNRQKNDALTYCYYVKKILTAMDVRVPISNTGIIQGGRIAEDFNFEGFCVYTVTFDLSLIIDLEQITLPTE